MFDNFEQRGEVFKRIVMELTQFTMQKLTKGKFDFLIFITVIILVLFGCVMVYSASYYSATIEEGDPACIISKSRFWGRCCASWP